jgi:hypothetical protein
LEFFYKNGHQIVSSPAAQACPLVLWTAPAMLPMIIFYDIRLTMSSAQELIGWK